MIIDAQVSNVLQLERLLQEEGYPNFVSVSDSREALASFLGFKPDLVLVDLHMPHLDGYGVMQQLRKNMVPDSFLPILVLTTDITPEAKRRALLEGATDFLAKPLDPVEATLRIRNLIQTRSLYLQLQDHNKILDQKVRKRTQQLEQAQIEILERLAQAAEYRDDDTGEHTQRVGKMVAQIAAGLGLPNEQVEQMRLAAPLHDIGKIDIPETILLKPGKLTPKEWKVIKSHTTIGAKILTGSQSPLLQMAEEIARTHHEHWDGNGYFGMKGDEIPLAGRIVTVVDVLDTLINNRPYKKAWPIKKAVDEIVSQRGKQFDPQVVDALLSIIPENLKA